jgi:hypothetical protein
MPATVEAQRFGNFYHCREIIIHSDGGDKLSGRPPSRTLLAWLTSCDLNVSLRNKISHKPANSHIWLCNFLLSGRLIENNQIVRIGASEREALCYGV